MLRTLPLGAVIAAATMILLVFAAPGVGGS
jgi:hypothetical protein